MIAIYVRQSILKDASLSIETQIKSCKQKFDSQTEPFEVYNDAGASGKNTNRGDFQRMFADIKSGKITKVIVYRLDRVSRSVKDFNDFYSELEKHKIEFVSCKENFDTTTTMGRLLLHITSAFAEMERDIIIERVTDNYYNRAKQGFYLGGVAPFGYNKIEIEYRGKKTAALEEDEERAQILRDAYYQYATTNISLGQLVKQLTKQGITTGNRRRITDENGNRVETETENVFSTASFGRILKNPIYVKADAEVYMYLKNKGAIINNDIDDYIGENGCYTYGSRNENTMRKFTDLTSQHVTLAPHRGIVSSDIWLMCQNKLDENKQLTNSGKGTHTWLSGLLKCGYCGFSISAVRSSNGAYYTNCYGRKTYVCSGRQKAVFIEDIEAVVEKMFLHHLEQIYMNKKSEHISLSENPEVKRIKSDIAKLTNQIENLAVALSTIEQSDNLQKLMNPILEQMSKLENQRQALTSELAKESYVDSAQNNLDVDISALIKEWPDYDLEKRKEIAKIFIKRVFVKDEEYHIQYR